MDKKKQPEASLSPSTCRTMNLCVADHRRLIMFEDVSFRGVQGSVCINQILTLVVAESQVILILCTSRTSKLWTQNAKMLIIESQIYFSLEHRPSLLKILKFGLQ